MRGLILDVRAIARQELKTGRQLELAVHHSGRPQKRQRSRQDSSPQFHGVIVPEKEKSATATFGRA